jgi:hypothetical protein
MGAVCILVPVVVAAWPALSAAVLAAASSLGYVVADDAARRLAEQSKAKAAPSRVDLEIPNSEVVTDQLGRAQHLSVTREGVTVTFSRDARGRAALCVIGEGYTEADLRAQGEELSRRVVQQYAYQKLKAELNARQFVVVEEQVDENHAIHLRVRLWEG